VKLARNPVDTPAMEHAVWTLALVLVLSAAGGRGYLRWRASRAVRGAEAGGDGHDALEALGRDFGTVVGVGIAVLGWLVARNLAASPSVLAGSWLAILLVVWWLYRGFSSDQLQLLEAYRGAAWNAPIHAALAALTLGPILGVPLCASLLAFAGLFAAEASGRIDLVAPLAALAVYPGLVVWGVWAGAVIRRHFRNPTPLPAAIRDRLHALLGAEAAESMVVLPVEGCAFYNAVALPSRREAKVWIADGLLAELSEDEAVATLLHEQCHVDQRDDLRRVGWTLALHALALWILWELGFTSGLISSTLLFAFVFVVASTLIGQRHELRADAAAARRGLAAPMGRALATLHRLNAVPSEAKNEGLMTHPLLARRLKALGVELAEADASPSGELAS
jgi:Zn-dependent protease with chaperone function